MDVGEHVSNDKLKKHKNRFFKYNYWNSILIEFFTKAYFLNRGEVEKNYYVLQRALMLISELSNV